ncbi:hypothetical protein PAXRUDRAFT_525055 [Paxillus rubicundulus Ve08.2h10]|uniref:Uncharacterized protein n=1 Tax=Paxillus rubicundulus Ve08.2h10 TaxID=930991 RepID=A0A0D0DBX0_9AGAM|nr:hypothetical protein PAXRUDRAFT_525055 [Paxillus rubicundulus Ve08.2h10]
MVATVIRMQPVGRTTRHRSSSVSRLSNSSCTYLGSLTGHPTVLGIPCVVVVTVVVTGAPSPSEDNAAFHHFFEDIVVCDLGEAFCGLARYFYS